MEKEPNPQQLSADNASRAAKVAADSEKRWYFSADQLKRTPSIIAGLSPDKELWYRYQCAELVQNIGQRLGLTQIAVNTAILYMHRFYQFHSLTKFHRQTMAPVFVFLAAKVEESPRRLEHVVRQTHRLLNPNEPPLVPDTERYLEEMQNMVTHENVLLQTLAFDMRVHHPHSDVIRCCQLIRCEKDLSHAAYALASCALHFTSLCIQYTPVLVASMCIHVASKWSNVKIPLSVENRPWYYYMDPTLTEAQIDRVTTDFLNAVESYPTRVRSKIWSQVLGQGNTPAATGSTAVSVNKPETVMSNTGSGAVPPPGSHQQVAGKAFLQGLPPSNTTPAAPSRLPAPPTGLPPSVPPPPPSAESRIGGLTARARDYPEDIHRHYTAQRGDMKASVERDYRNPPPSRYSSGASSQPSFVEETRPRSGVEKNGTALAAKKRKADGDTAALAEHSKRVV